MIPASFFEYLCRDIFITDLPPRYSIDDCPPDYYDIYPPKSIPLSSLAKVTSPAVAATTVTTATNDTITPSEAVPNDNAVTAQSSSSQAQHDEVDEVSHYNTVIRYIFVCKIFLYDYFCMKVLCTKILVNSYS